MPEPLFADGDPPSKRAVLAAALRLFARDGYDGTSIRDIAREAGYTNPALFKFFASKDELGAYLFLRGHHALVGRIAPHLRDDADLEDTLRGWVGAWLDLLAEHRDLVIFVHENVARFWPSVRAQVEGGDPFARLLAWLERARAAGRVSSATPARLQATLLVGYFHQLARLHELGALGDRRDVEAATCRLLLGALRS
ncbi:MAG: TetR/AcrR family transcriptional regulator [Myxococcota bacterium]